MTKVRMKIVFANSTESLGGMLLFKCNFKDDDQFINEKPICQRLSEILGISSS